MREFILCFVIGVFLSDLACAEPAAGLASVEVLLRDFQSSGWIAVTEAKEALESEQGDAVDALLRLMDDDSVVPLRDLGDTSLGYGGAASHGMSIPYDLNRISVRAGWLLEDLAFQRFGFAACDGVDDPAIRDELVRQGQLQGGANCDAVATSRSVQLAVLAIAKRRARSWWGHTRKRWSRLEEWVMAVRSGESDRVARAVRWFVRGRTACDGLDRQTYRTVVVPELAKLSAGGNSQAKAGLQSGQSLAMKLWANEKRRERR